MSEEKKQYAFFVRESFAYDWVLVSIDGKVIPLTLRDYVDISLGNNFKQGFLLRVSCEELIEDIKQGYKESKYLKMFGWNYARATEMAESEGMIFVLLCGSQFEARPYSYVQVRDDDDYAFQLVRDIYSVRGGRVMFEEFDPEKHVKGYRPKLDT